MRYCEDNADAIMQARNSLTLPLCLNDRAQDAWELLFAIDAVAGGTWLDRLTHAAQVIQATADALEEHGFVEILAADLLNSILPEYKGPNVASHALVMALHDMDGGIWQEYGPNGLKQTSLARMLGDMGAARPKNVKTEGQVLKGHEVSDLLEVCARYASPLGGAQNATPLPGNNYAAKTVADDETLPATKALPPELEPKSPENAPGSGVAFPAPPNPKEEKCTKYRPRTRLNHALIVEGRRLRQDTVNDGAIAVTRL